MSDIPAPGKTYKVVVPFRTLADVEYEVGDCLRLIAPTPEAPFGFEGKDCNWVVECKHFTPPRKESVWSSIRFLIKMGFIRAEIGANLG